MNRTAFFIEVPETKAEEILQSVYALRGAPQPQSSVMRVITPHLTGVTMTLYRGGKPDIKYRLVNTTANTWFVEYEGAEELFGAGRIAGFADASLKHSERRPGKL